MLKRVLVANRGEIALRIVRELSECGIESVAVYSTADKDALHVILADKSLCIGPPAPKDSYLNMDAIIEAAIRLNCDGIHPGFGFLSENSEFARKCEAEGIKFIGPSAGVIDAMGNKSNAKSLMKSCGVPIVPGSSGVLKDLNEAMIIAGEIGYPVLLKASLGGGGRGMRRAYSPQELESAFNEASAEALSCFGDASLYMEKLIENPRHIEIQILADGFGNVIHLGERNCSMQRRNQKMLEESPAVGLSEETRRLMGEAAVKAAIACGYEGAGTVEFVVDREGNFYFIEMNTRIQVEHPVTELLTGVNIVKEQLRIASGKKLSYSQEDIKPLGHVIECRITAEEPLKNFRPSAGKLKFVHFPGGNGVRVDSAIHSGAVVSPYYDSMLAKIIVRADNRKDAIRKMRRALEETIIEGIPTSLPANMLILYHREFMKGRYDTGFIDRHMDEVLEVYTKAGGK